VKLDPEERIIAAALDQAELDDAKERGAGARITRSRKPPNLARHGGSCQLITLSVHSMECSRYSSATRAVDQLWMRRRRGRSSGRRTDGCARPGRAPARIGGGHNGGAAIIAAMVPIGATVIGAVIPDVGAAVSSVRRPRTAATRFGRCTAPTLCERCAAGHR